jgi:hypothetical protein
MKIISTIAIAVLASSAIAAETNKSPVPTTEPNKAQQNYEKRVDKKERATSKSTATWISKLDVATVGVLKTQELDSRSQWGTGVDVGVGLNTFVALHASLLTYEGYDEWRGGSIDEVSLGIQASLSRFSTESFLPYVIAGGVHSFEPDDFGLSLGAGAKVQFNEYWAIGGDYSVRAWFNGPEDGLARLYLQYSF